MNWDYRRRKIDFEGINDRRIRNLKSVANPYAPDSALYNKFEENRNSAISGGSRRIAQLTPQQIYNLSEAGKLKQSSSGQTMVEGGTNMYGFDRPDTYLLRGGDNQLLDPFKEQVGESVNKLKEYGMGMGENLDPRAQQDMGSAFKKLEGQALGSGDFEEIALARQRANNQSLADVGKLNRQALGNMNSQISQMAMRGGAASGAMERMGRSSMRDQLLGQQGIAAQNRDQNLQLSIENAGMRNNMLRDVGNVQQNISQFNANAFTNDQNRRLDALTKAGSVEQDVNRSNVGALRSDVDKQNLAAQNMYGEDMSLYGAAMTAKGQKASAPKSSGCCFIFLEARYGDGTMDNVVRKFRDEHMTAKNKRGYYKLSEVLVPLMRKHKLVKLAVRALMTDPMVSYGKAYYGEGKLGFIFKPLVKFWLNTFDFLGGEHKFIRENGEVV